MISFTNKHVFIHDLTYLTLQIMLNAWWASINVRSKHPIAWNDSRHAPLWRFYLHCGIEKTSIPGVMCIVCHQVLPHRSEHGTSSMGTHLLAKAHIATLNKLTVLEDTESTSSTVNDAALAIPKRQGSWGSTMVSLQRKFIFDIQVRFILTELSDKSLWIGS